MLDALENEIALGQVYGYSTKDNVVIGRAVNLTKLKVTLEVIKVRNFLYGEQTKNIGIGAATTSVFSWHLFPVKE